MFEAPLCSLAFALLSSEVSLKGTANRTRPLVYDHFLCKEGKMFTYLDDSLRNRILKIPSTSNQIEGGIDARLRAMLG